MAQSLIFSLLFLLFPLSYGKPQTNSKLSCVCQAYQDCAWSENQVDQLAVLPKDHQNYKPLFEDFKAQICEPKKRDVWCCRGSEKADPFELVQLNGVTTATKITTKTTTTKIIEQDTRKITGTYCIETPFYLQSGALIKARARQSLSFDLESMHFS